MVQRILCVIILVLVVTLRAARPDEKITIWWAQWEPADALQVLGEKFSKETGIGVEVIQIPWTSYQDQVFLNFGNDATDFDIVIGDSQWIGRGATKGLYLDLTEWLPTAVDMSSVHPQAARYLCEYPPGSGSFYAAPCETDAIGFIYRRDWFEDPAEKKAFETRYGRDLMPPDTWQEFRDIAEFFHRPEQKRYGTSLLTGREYDSIVMGFQPFLWAWGGDWGDPETFEVDGILNSVGAVEGLRFFIDLMQYTTEGGTNADYVFNLEAFSNGSTAMVLDYFPFYPGIVKQMGEVAGFFRVPRNGQRRFISLGGQGFSISTKTSVTQQDLAKKFIAWFQKREIQEEWITFPGCFTANIKLLESKKFREASPYNKTFAESLDYLRDFWNVPVYNELLAAAVQNIGEALDGVQEPKQALDALVEEHELILLDAGLLTTD